MSESDVEIDVESDVKPIVVIGNRIVMYRGDVMALEMELIDVKDAPVRSKSGKTTPRMREIDSLVAKFLSDGDDNKIGKIQIPTDTTNRAFKTQMSWGVRRYNEATGLGLKAQTWDKEGFLYFRITDPKTEEADEGATSNGAEPVAVASGAKK